MKLASLSLLIKGLTSVQLRSFGICILVLWKGGNLTFDSAKVELPRSWSLPNCEALHVKARSRQALFIVEELVLNLNGVLLIGLDLHFFCYLNKRIYRWLLINIDRPNAWIFFSDKSMNWWVFKICLPGFLSQSLSWRLKEVFLN
jgi:hypothetical protein